MRRAADRCCVVIVLRKYLISSMTLRHASYVSMLTLSISRRTRKNTVDGDKTTSVELMLAFKCEFHSLPRDVMCFVSRFNVDWLLFVLVSLRLVFLSLVALLF